MNSLRTDTVATDDWQSRHWQLRVDYCELEAELVSVWEDFWFVTDLLLHVAELLQSEGYCLGCEIPAEDLADGESACDLLDLEEVEPLLPPKPKHLRIVK